MNNHHTIGMNTNYLINIMSKRLTVSMPEHVYEQLRELVPKGKLSQFVTEAVKSSLLEEKIERSRRQAGQSPVERFLAWRDKLPKYSDAEIKRAIEKGRM
jgi:hypothetical protein